MVYILLVTMVLINATANTVIRCGMSKAGDGEVAQIILKGVTNPLVLLGVLLFTVGLCIYFYVLSKLNLSIAYPMVISLEIICVLLFSWIFLKEQMVPVKLLGCSLIVGGIWLVAK